MMSWFHSFMEFVTVWFFTFDHDEHDPGSHVVSVVVNGTVTHV